MYLMCHLKRFSSFYQNAILCSNPCANHDSCRGCQAKRTRAGDAQHCNGGLEGKANHCLNSGDAFVITLQGKKAALLFLQGKKKI